MESFILIVIVAMLAGLVQGITGFGAGIIMMMVLPMFFALPQSAGISSAICIVLGLSMVLTYRKHIRFQKIIGPSCLYLIICSGSIVFSTMVNQELMKKIFGCFLIVLSLYYLLINKDGEKKTFHIFISILFIAISAICDGLFGIGGPLMVLYFLSTTENTHEYLGTIQMFFV